MVSEKTIIEKSTDLYIKYGIKSVGVDDVAFMLGISKKTLYERIENKNLLIQKVVENNLDDFYNKTIAKVQCDENVFVGLSLIYFHIIKNIKRINPSYIHDLKRYHNKEYQKIIEFRDGKLFECIESCIKKGIKEGFFRKDTNIRQAYWNHVVKISMLFTDSVFDYSESFSCPQILKMILDDIRGITTLEGHKMMDEKYDQLLHIK